MAKTEGSASRGRRPRRRLEGGSDDLNRAFAALSDPTRRAMVARLSLGECSVTMLSEPFALTAPAVSKHLRVLERAALIERRKVGRVRFCRLRVDALNAAGEWIQQQRAFWEQQFDALAAYLRTDEP